MAALGLVLAGTARAQPADEAFELRNRGAEAFPTQGGQISLQQAIEMATRRYPGTVVKADTITVNGRTVHVIRILGDDSRVRTVQIDAQAGGGR